MPSFLQPLGITAGAQFLGGVDLLVDDLGLEVFGGDDSWHEELCRRVIKRHFRLDSLSCQELHRDVGRGRGDDFARLGDRVVLIPRYDQLQCGDRRIIAGHRRYGVDTGCLEGGDGAAAGPVIGGDDADDLFAEAGDLAGRPLLRIRRLPVRRVEFGKRLVAAAGETLVNAVLDQPGGRIRRRTVDLQDAAAVGRHVLSLQMLDERFRDCLADRLVVKGDVEIGLARRDRTVIGDDLDTLALGELDERCGGCRIHRIEHDDLGSLGDGRIELLLLFGDIGIGILIDDLA